MRIDTTVHTAELPAILRDMFAIAPWGLWRHRLRELDRREKENPHLSGYLAHLIHRIAGIRRRAWYKPLKSRRDWLSTPLSMRGQDLPCPPPTTIRFCHSLCQISARRRSPPHSMVA